MCFSLKVPLSLNNELKQADMQLTWRQCSSYRDSLENFKFTFSLFKISSVFLITFVLSYVSMMNGMSRLFFTYLLVVMPAFVALPGSWLKLRFKSLLWISIFFFGKTRFSQFNRGLAIKIKPTQRIIKTWSVTKGLSSLLESVHLSSIMKIKIEMIRHLF